MCWDALSTCSHPKHNTEQQSHGDTGYEYKAAEPWAQAIIGVIRPGEAEGDFVCSRRLCPDWYYFHEYRSRVAVLRSTKFVETWRRQISSHQTTELKGVHGRLVMYGDSKHFVSNAATKRAVRVLRAVGETVKAKELPYVAFENRLIFFGKYHAIAIYQSAGRAAFEIERAKVRKRYEAESQMLFPASTFSWSESVSPEAFEALVCELLSLEPNVLRVRRAGVTRERDGGRDLIADWIVPPTNTIAVNSMTLGEVSHVVVQCKASKSTVGKSKVQDLRDTVEAHGANGYFLAVSTEISGSLISHLEELNKRRGWFVEWWTRLEIETRLRRHPDVAARYTAIAQPK